MHPQTYAKTVRPGLTAAMTAGRALLAAGWRYDSTTPMADDTTIRTLLHPSGREIHARTVDRDDDDTTSLTMTGLSLEQVAGAIAGAGITPTDEPEHYLAGGSAGELGACSAECICGLTYAGFDTHAEAAELIKRHVAEESATKPTERYIERYMSCPRECGVDVREHNSSDLVDGKCDTAPDYWLTLADDLRQVADRIATLAGSPPPARAELTLLGAYPQDANPANAALVDAVAGAFDTTPVSSSVGDKRAYESNPKIGNLCMDIRTYLPNEESELERLRARVAELESQRTEGGEPR